MKIIMFVSRFLPSVGGVEKHVWEVSRRLAQTGHEVVVVTHKHDPSLPLAERIGQVSVIRLPFSWRNRVSYANVWAWLLRNRQMLRGADVLHVHDFSPFIFWLLPLRWLFWQRSIDITFHGYEAFPIPLKYRILRRVTAALTRRIMSVGDFIQKWYGTRADVVIYGGVDHVPEALPKGNNSPMVAVFVGRLAKDTGVREYIEAAVVLKRLFGMTLEIDVCGDGPLRRELEEIAALADLPVSFHGFTDPTAYVSRARFVFASSYLAILEGLVQGKTVIAHYQNPLKRDYLLMMPGANSVFWVAANTGHLAELIRIKSLATTAEVDQEARMALEFCKTRTWDAVVAAYLDLWGVNSGRPALKGEPDRDSSERS